jgi:hypothetical protein
MFDGWSRERKVRRVLRGLSRQHVAMFLQPGNLWVIEKALPRTDQNEAALRTCLMRGWIEALHENMPTGDIEAFLANPNAQMFTRSETIFRLTEGGWAALNRAHAWALVNTLLALASVTVAVWAIR